ncbi:MAG: hypothetical protein Kow0059_04180 [Candidatus Sumerlaeia bacterium]
MENALRLGDFNLTMDVGRRLTIAHYETYYSPLAELMIIVYPREGQPIQAQWQGILTSMSKTGLFRASAEGLSIQGSVEYQPDLKAMNWTLDVLNAHQPVECALEVRLILLGQGVQAPRWMVPGFFYKHNRLEKCQRLFPGYSSDEQPPARFLSPWWRFRADRCADPIVFAWTSRTCAYLGTTERFEKGLAGLGFEGRRNENPTLSLWFPYREEPVKYSFFRTDKTAPEITWMTLQADEELRLHFMVGFTPQADLHAYAPVLRGRYERALQARKQDRIRSNDARPHPEPSWVSHAEGAALAAEGLYHLHYDEEENVIYETCAFDKYFGKFGRYVDRPNMHVAWISGAPCAYSLLWYGHDRRREDYVRAARGVLDKITSEQTPIGTLWGRWVEHGVWDTGWNPEENWIHTRTLAEACLFILRALRVERMNDNDHPQWSEAVRRTLEYILQIQREDGSFGTYYNVQTGAVEEWEGAGGILWISALLLANDIFNDERMQQAAERAGAYYEQFIEDEFLFGAPEDVHLTPTSEDGYNALMAYMHLYQYRFLKRWLRLCQKSADWLLSFRFAYDVEFPEKTILRHYNYKTFGGDIASVSNAHIHCYGLICHPELKKLSIYLEDDFYQRRAMEHLECSLQGLARADGDMNARRGMISEQFYYTDWWQPKGAMLQLSHAWCLGLILYACLYETSVAGLETVFR